MSFYLPQKSCVSIASKSVYENTHSPLDFFIQNTLQKGRKEGHGKREKRYNDQMQHRELPDSKKSAVKRQVEIPECGAEVR